MTRRERWIINLLNELDTPDIVVGSSRSETGRSRISSHTSNQRSGVSSSLKFTVTFKTPDAVADEARYKAEEDFEYDSSLNREDMVDWVDEKEREYREFAGQWVGYGEYVTIEFDLEAGTATVVKS